MDGRVSGPTGAPPTAGSPVTPPLVGRRDVLDEFSRLLNSIDDGMFILTGLAGEPGAGKTRLLAELAAGAEDRGLLTLWGRAAEFEQELPFGAVVDALDDQLEKISDELPDRLGTPAVSQLATVFPALYANDPDDPGPRTADSGLGRYGVYRAIRRLLEELAEPAGLALILDDLHWADEASIELLDHLVRHRPNGRVLTVVAHRPAQASPRLAALMESAPQIRVSPLNEAEVEEFLGPKVSRARRRTLFEASGGNPFYLEALARMGREPVVGGDDQDEVPQAIRAALRMELSGLSPTALSVAQGAAVAADEFEPALAAIAAELPEDRTLEAISELVARDVAHPASAGRFRFRHPLVRHAAYGSAAAGWRVAAHARVAAHLAVIGAPATVRARHVERSGYFGDANAIATLVEAARTVSAQAPATAAHWLEVAVGFMPADPDNPDARLDLLLELAEAQGLSGHLGKGRETARELLRLLPLSDHARRARAVRFCAMMERHLSRPHQARALLLDELRRIPDARSAAAVPLRLRLVAESLIRSDYRAAQAVLDLMPDSAPGWDPSIPMAISTMRPLPALAAGRIADAVRYVEEADRYVTAAPDDHLAEWLDAFSWLCWTETMMGRYQAAQRHFDRAVSVARATGQAYIVSTLLAGRARIDIMLGRLADAMANTDEAAELARLLGSRQQLVIALTQQCLAATWSGDDGAAIQYADQAVRTSADTQEWWGSFAKYGQAMALINAGRLDEGAVVMLAALDGFSRPRLDPTNLLSCCETMAQLEAARGRTDEAELWASRAEQIAHSELKINTGLARLARAHARSPLDPAETAEHAVQAAEVLSDAGLRIDAGRARLRAGTAFAEAGDRNRAREELRAATEAFTACGARSLLAQATREQRRLGVRVPSTAGRGVGPRGLSRRESEVATLVVAGYTNQQIAEKLFLSIRTVETHLSHIFTKLGVTSRVGVVSAMNEPA
jgi:DNA-binding CsgD family transcriptional regulator/tetratricopeptide (TPR) repeat protein